MQGTQSSELWWGEPQSLPVTLSHVRSEVSLPFGTLEGNRHAHSDEYLGVPYAQRPTRFEPAAVWSDAYHNGTLDATRFSDQCLQLTSISLTLGLLLENPAQGLGSEDCLFLNVYVPRPAQRATPPPPLPVMIFIHGGSLQQGTAMDPMLNGSHLAASQGLVVVTINYRLGALGFLPLKHDDGTITSNNGFRDQQEAMRWVQRHIAAFGGDPGKVTLFGESAGGQSIAVHLVSPSSAGLFQAAILESPDIFNFAPLDFALNNSRLLATEFACHDFECMQRVNASQLLGASSQLPVYENDAIAAIIDGDILPAAPLERVQQKTFNRVPVMLGTNADEASLLTLVSSWTAAGVRCVIQKGFDPRAASTVLNTYLVTNGSDNRQVLVDLLSDSFFRCPARTFAKALSEAYSPTYMYSFQRTPPCTAIFGTPGAYHGSEIPYVFQTLSVLPRNSTCVIPAADQILAVQIGSLWGQFARGKAAKGWPLYQSPGEQVVKLDVGVDTAALQVEAEYRVSECDALDGLGLPYGDFLQVASAQLDCDPET